MSVTISMLQKEGEVKTLLQNSGEGNTQIEQVQKVKEVVAGVNAKMESETVLSSYKSEVSKWGVVVWRR